MKQMAFALALFCLLTLLVPAAGYLAGGYLKLPTQPLALAQPDNPSDPQQEDLQQTETAQSSPAPAGQTGMIVVQDASTGQVLEIPVLEYMIGAVASEMPIDWPDEALKAQAIAAHSYALYQRDHADTAALGGAWFSVEPARRLGYMSQEVLQSYWGDAFETNYNRLKELFTPLEDTVLLYEGQPAAACYHAISNGRTQASQAVWEQSLPYLQGVDSPLDKGVEGYSCTVEYSTQQVYDILAAQVPGANLEGDPSGWFGSTSWNDWGYVDRVEIGGVFVRGTQFRTLMGLRSSCFSIEQTENGFAFTTLGYGHGVGLSQSGAAAMAAQGQTCQEILAWYYPGTQLGSAE